jgi:nitrogen fixation NifU-like protein
VAVLEELYQEVILEHSRNPRNFGPLENADRTAVGYNASCGDDIQVHLKFSGDWLSSVHFTGEGCAISKASASLMVGAVEGLKISTARIFVRHVIDVISGRNTEPVTEESLGSCAVLLGVRRFPMRIKCATLAWHALETALKENNT